MKTSAFNLLLFLLMVVFCGHRSAAQTQTELELEKVVDVSRHGLRAPLEQYLETLDRMSGEGYQWMRWSVPGSHLTPKGDTLSRYLGEYFRLWFREEGFELDSADVYLGASSKQRTVATARAFAEGLLPGVTLPVDYKKSGSTYGFLDPDYLPLFNDHSSSDGLFDTAAFQREARRELGELLPPSYDLLEKVLRMDRSEYAKRRGSGHFDSLVGVNLYFYGALGKRMEPNMQGGLKDANMASDALILQYYELGDSPESALGHSLSCAERKSLASIKDYYGYLLFSKAPIISVNVSHCMLERVYAEMKQGEGHRYAFFCTHDSMIEALLAALRVVPYELPNTIESKTPIGVKVLFEQWKEKGVANPKRYVRVRIVYQSTNQIIGSQRLDLDNPPMSYELSFAGMEKTNGMYRYEDFMAHLEETLMAYDATAKGRHPWQ